MQKHSVLIAVLALAPLSAFTAEQPEEGSRRVRAWQQAQETGICELHGTAMTKKIVSIIYGIPTWQGADPATRLKLFPHAREKFFGGCVIIGEKTKLLYICPNCQRAEWAWNKENSK